ncbi:MAG: class I SAM-dependent rRNA methyltransferase [Candidatus Omnitrophica bacterium]|nr:class I SAM-dependent rRNA methyltransferase [Candidatus Omnitrophota bacterium]
MKNERDHASIILKKGKEKPVINHHHWIFSGAIMAMPRCGAGDIVPVKSFSGDLLGHAYINPATSITARMINFDDASPLDSIRRAIQAALKLRKALFNERTTGYRLINAEGDGLPGLIADWYNGLIVLQVSTLGMERLKRVIVEILCKELNPIGIYEKSVMPGRAEEGLSDSTGVLYGTLNEPVEILESGIRFLVRVTDSQKTGFYFDQRQMRELVKDYAGRRRVLNCFSYTGAFTVCALKGGAMTVDSVDTSAEALQQAKENVTLNSCDTGLSRYFEADVFEFLRVTHDAYDFIILDPPAFAKKASDVVKACRGYKDINRSAIKRVQPGGIILTCSCSYHIDATLFQQVVFQASREAERNVRILQRHHLAPDHPVNIYHPEGEYLKSLVLYVE